MFVRLKPFFRSLLLLLVLSFVVVACVQSPNATRKSKTNANSEDSATATPTFSTNTNFFQLGQNTYNSTLPLPANYTDSFYLRGNQVHYFINIGNQNSGQCLVSYFPASTGARFFVTLATPSYFLNQSTGVKEFYYLIQPSNSTQNKTFCQKTGLLSALSTIDSTATIAYRLADICPTCNVASTLTSNPISLYSSGGSKIGDIATSYLRIYLTGSANNTTTVGSCTSTSQCVSSGYQCCVDNQCANDGQVKSGVDTTSAAYQAALQDILSNPSSIKKYSNFFYICSSNPSTNPNTGSSTQTTDNVNAANARLIKMRELYMCTTLIKGEMSVCTVTYSNANTNTTPFTTAADDRSFQTTNSNLPRHSLYEVSHAGITLYKNNSYQTSPVGFYIGDNSSPALYTGNDNLTEKLQIRLNHSITTPNDDLKISYKIDGSCKQINTSLAQCSKYYVQGQNTGNVDDHYPGTDTFLLPTYADTSRQIKVEVDDLTRQQDTEWTLNSGSPASISFIGNGQQVYDTQVVKFTFYVSLASYPNILLSKQTAQKEIGTLCACSSSTTCSLAPAYDSSGNIVNYTCVYPQPEQPNTIPMQQEVMLSSKNVPVRLFDSSGVAATTATLGLTQEGTAFKYINNDKKKPNNYSAYVGFNEIYGSLTYDPTSAKPAIEVTLEKGKTYSIFVDDGLFSSCTTCGNDYYATTTQLFPIAMGGGGLNPTYYQNITDKFLTKGASYNADNFIFGRACFVPATMIPWSHKAKIPRNDQRLERLATQHFLFANGYQRDWYGFDYGSVIGSFDGVTWFSIGTQRQIFAKSKKLFLAVNAYFGDLTSESTYKVTITDSTASPSSGATVTRDYDSDGAQCQQFHSCSTDRDCVTKLGWDYTCQSVTGIQSSWPVFDANALETPGKSQTVRLSSLIGDIGSSSKRCVYRGRGAPCYTDYIAAADTASTNFDGTEAYGLHACSSNSYCQVVKQGALIAKFNNRINRLPYSPKSYNEINGTSLSTFGFGAKMLGRPFEHSGTATVPDSAITNLSANNIAALCIPGRSVGSSYLDRILTLSSTTPDSDELGDLVNNQGVTPIGNTANRGYLSSCPVLDTSGNYVPIQTTTASRTTRRGDLAVLAGAQNIPTNSLRALQASLDSSLTFLKNFPALEGQINAPAIQENRCLRAPFASCHTDFDCAPSEWIASKLTGIGVSSTNNGVLGINSYELQFWKEGLVCGQSETKTTVDSTYGEIVNPNYALKNNRCCRDIGKTLTIGTYSATLSYTAEYPNFKTSSIPSIDTDLTDKTRYSRFATVQVEMKEQASSYPALSTNTTDIDDIYKQFNTFATVAERSCCTANWVRNFHTDNGGGHTWSPSKAQNIPITSLRCYNWSKCVVGDSCSATSPVTGATGFSCSHTQEPTDIGCLMRAIPSTETHAIFNWLNSLEILGVPQSSVATEDFSNIRCIVDPLNQASDGTTTPPNIVKETVAAQYTGVSDEDSTLSGSFVSGQVKSNFYSSTGGIKMIFSRDTISCCRPAGYTVASGSDPNICCTGVIDSTTNRCVLPDYSNVSVYFNRYVSSAAKTLDLAYFNQRTGFIKDRSKVLSLACSQKVCQSGYLGTGVAYAKLPVRGHENNSDAFKYRYIESTKDPSTYVNSYNYGLRWNDDVYCIPEALAKTPIDGMTVMSCN